MIWETMVNIIHAEFVEWCGKYKASPSTRTMIEYLGAEGYLKMRKIATEFTEKGKVPSLGFHDYMSIGRMQLREGFLLPTTVVYPKKKKEKKYEHGD